MVFKTAFIGAHGANKTTRSRAYHLALRDAGFNVVLIPEMATEAYRAGMRINEAAGFEVQRWIIEEQIRREREAEAAGAFIIVADRSPLDALVYSRDLYERGRITVEELNEVAKLALGWMGTYSKLYLCKPRHLIDDGVRSTDPEFQRRIAALFDEVVATHGIKVTRL